MSAAGITPGASLLEVLTLQDYATQKVVIGTTLLGMAAGVIGTFTYLRKRALMGDALSHATLPGIAAAFMLTGTKTLGALVTGATITGILGILCVLALRHGTRLKEDAAIGIVLSVFFALGLVLLGVIQQMSTGGQAGLPSFIYGKAAAMLHQETWLIAWVAAAVLAGVALLFKQFRLICFDQEFAAAAGHPVLLIDLAMMALVVATTVVGLQAVGLIMIIALLIIPAAAARFWTERLLAMTCLAALLGALSGWSGSVISALVPRMPTGAIIVICAGVLFAVSLLAAPYRGVIGSFWRDWSLSRKVHDQHLLRALAEIEELRPEGEVRFEELMPRRSWTRSQLRRIIARARRRGYLTAAPSDRVRLTPDGRTQARRVLRNHRLWEAYLIRYADIAPSHVDRDADEVEHILSEPLIRELEAVLESDGRIPSCPHSPEVAGS